MLAVDGFNKLKAVFYGVRQPPEVRGGKGRILTCS